MPYSSHNNITNYNLTQTYKNNFMNIKLTNRTAGFTKIILLTSIISLPSFTVMASSDYVPDYIAPFLYSGTAPGSSTSQFGLQGITGGDTIGTFLVTGTSGNNGVVYNGPINNAFTSAGSGSGTWSVINVPDEYVALSTSIYGVDNLGSGAVNLVGSYVSGTTRIGFYYDGPLSGAGGFKSYQAHGYQDRLATFTYIHSISGGLAVGNYDYLGDGNPLGKAFIYDPSGLGSQIDISYPDASGLTHTAYGIWYNGGSSYTIAGGAGVVPRNLKGATNPNKIAPDYDQVAYGDPIGYATLIDYDSETGEFTNYQTYSFKPTGSEVKRWKNKTLVTHFEGIWSDGAGTYKLPATVVATNAISSGAEVATIKRQRNGKFSKHAKWTPLIVNGSSLTTNDSIFGDTSVGLAIYPALNVVEMFVSDYAVTPILK